MQPLDWRHILAYIPKHGLDISDWRYPRDVKPLKHYWSIIRAEYFKRTNMYEWKKHENKIKEDIQYDLLNMTRVYQVGQRTRS